MRRKILRKAVSYILTLCMIVGLVLGSGDGSFCLAADTFPTTVVTCSNGTRVTFKGELSGDVIKNVHIIVADTSGSNTIPDGTVIKVPDKISEKPVISLGNTETDSMFVNVTVDTGTTGVTLDASGTHITTVNSNVGHGKTGISLKLPKTLETLGADVLSSSSDAGNHIYIDSLNTTISGSSYPGVTFHCYKQSQTKANLTAKSITPVYDADYPSAELPYSCGSILCAFDLNDTAGTPNASYNGGPSSVYAYASDQPEYTAFSNLDTTKLPTKKHFIFEGYYENDTATDPVFTKQGVYCGYLQPTSGGSLTATVTETLALKARWSKGTVLVTLNPNGGTGGITSLTPLYGEDCFDNLPTTGITREGYTFRGWSTNALGNTPLKKGEAAFTDDTELFAIWDVNSYNVKYNPNYPNDSKSTKGSTVPETVRYAYTEGALELKKETVLNYSASGYTFGGWSRINDKDPDKQRVVGRYVSDAISGLNPGDTVELYAKWIKGSYTVEFYNYGSLLTRSVFDCNGKVTWPSPVPTRTGYTFAGWATSETVSPIEYPAGSGGTVPDPQKDLFPMGTTNVLVARFNANSYTVKYEKNDGDEGDAMLPDTWSYDQDIQIRDCAYTHPGAKFVGWSRVKRPVLNATESENNIRNMTDFNVLDGGTFPRTTRNLISSGEITYYPVWQYDTYTIAYNYPSDATVVGNKPTSYTYGQVFTLPTLTRPKYTFKGWYDNSGNLIQQIPSAMSGNITLTAGWEGDLIVKIAGSNIQRVEASSKVLVNNGTITGETFKDKTALSGFKIKAYENQLITSCTIKSEGSSTAQISRTFPAPANEIMITESAVFSGANLVIEITVKATEYKITFDTDGGTIVGIVPTSYTYGTETKLPTNVVKDGYLFYGWKNSAGTIVTTIGKTQVGDLTFTAVWNDPNIVGLPSGTIATVSMNGKYLTLTYKDKTTEEIYLFGQGIQLINGSNTIQFRTPDNKIYLTTVDYTTATEMPDAMGSEKTSDGTHAVITYPDGTKQQVVINKYNADVEMSGTRIYFDGLDGKRYTTIIGSTLGPTPVDPSPEPSPEPSDDPDTPSQKPKSNEYYMIHGVSYNIKGGVARVTNPSKWNAASLTIRPTVTVYDRNYKVTRILTDAFYGMGRLKKAVIGKNVTAIGKRAFSLCKKLKTIIFKGGKVTSIGKNAFYRIAKNALIKIKASKKKYKKLVKLIKKKSGCPKSTRFKRIK